MTNTFLDSRRAWLVAAAACAANFVAFGILFSFGVFLTPIAEDFGTTNGPTSALFSVAIFVYYIAGAVGGRLGDRHGIRPLVLVAAVFLPLGLYATSRAGALWVAYLTFAPLVGVAVGCVYAPMIGAVGRWFERWRLLAVGLLTAGVGSGTLIVPIVARSLVDSYGWRTTFVIFAVVSGLVIGLAALVADSPPGDAAMGSSDFVNVLRTRRFRRLYLSVVLIGPGFYAVLAFTNDYATDRGIGGAAAAALVGISGASSVIGRLLIGLVTSPSWTLAQYRLGYALLTSSLLVWLLADSSYVTLVGAALLHGMGWAAWVTAAPAVLGEWFGIRDMGGLIGTFYTGVGVGALVGPAVSGFVIDAAGYRWAIASVLATSTLALALISLPMPDDDPRPADP